MKFALAASTAFALALVTAGPLTAQDASTGAAASAEAVQPGTSVFGPDGAEIGTIVAAEGEAVLIKVGDRNVPIARTALKAGANGATLPLTREQLTAEFDQQVAAYRAKLDSAVVAGAEVRTADDRSLGTIAAVAEQGVQVTGPAGSMTLPLEALALDREGSVRVQATMEQIRQAAAAAAPAQ